MSNEMKDSGSEWIGLIPNNWKTMRFKYLISSLYSGGTPNTACDNFYSDSGIPFVSISDMSNGGFILSTKKFLSQEGVKDKNLKIIHSGTILYSIYASVGEVSELKIEAAISQAILAIDLNENIDKNYAKYELQAIKEYAFSRSNGNTQINLNAQIVKNFPFCLGTKREQLLISNFLDRKMLLIQNAIQNNEKQIASLKQFKQTLITETVSKGLDSSVPLKNTGFEWIRQIPSNWSTIKIKYVAWLKGRIGWDGLTSSEFCDDGPFLITGTDFVEGYVDWSSCVHISQERFEEDIDLHIKENDLLITKDGTVGKLAIAINCPPQVSLNSGVMIIRNNSNYRYETKYLFYVLQSDQFLHWYELSQKGNSTIKHLYQGQFYDFVFSYPDISLQKGIVKFLDVKCNKIDLLIKMKELKIEKLYQFKKSLIYDYVTGKRRVNL